MSLRKNLVSAAAAFVLAFGVLSHPAAAAPIIGMAAMGASETQGTDYKGSWVPYLSNLRGINFGGSGSPYNVAVGGATSTTLLSPYQQHTKVATLVDTGKVNVVSLSIGGNDYGQNAVNLLLGKINPATLGNQVVTNISTAIDTVLAENPAAMIVWGVPDMALTAQGQLYVTTPELQALAEQIMADVNPQLKQEVLDRDLIFIDLAKAMYDLSSNPLVVGGVTINTVTASSSNPRHLWQDGIHPGYVGNGLFANLAIAALNIGYGQNISYITDQEILSKAGLSSSYTGQTSNIDWSQYVFTAVPEPSTVALAAIGVLIVGIAGVRRRR